LVNLLHRHFVIRGKFKCNFLDIAHRRISIAGSPF